MSSSASGVSHAEQGLRLVDPSYCSAGRGSTKITQRRVSRRTLRPAGSSFISPTGLWGLGFGIVPALHQWCCSYLTPLAQLQYMRLHRAGCRLVITPNFSRKVDKDKIGMISAVFPLLTSFRYVKRAYAKTNRLVKKKNTRIFE